MTDQFEVQRFARDFARRLAKLERAQRRTAASPNTLNHAAIDGGELVVKDDQGQVKYHLGTDPVTGVTAPKFELGPVPAQPEAPDVESREGAVHVVLSGLDVDEQPAPEDLRHVEIHMSLDEAFEVSPGTMVTSTPNPTDGVSISKASGVWWVRVVWVTLSGQRSEPSDAVSVDIVPPVDAQDIQDTLDAAQARLDEYRDEVAAPRFQALEEGLETHEVNIADARDRLTTAEQTLSPLPGRIESAEQDVATAQVEATKAAAAAVEANNRAMTRLANGNFESGLDYWKPGLVLSDDSHSGSHSALVNVPVSTALEPSTSLPVIPGQIWELNFYYKSENEEATKSALRVEMVDGGSDEVLETWTLRNPSHEWVDSGTFRHVVPENTSMLTFRVSRNPGGWSISRWLVDDITLRDVTDVVRLEQAANANRQKAEQAISELEVLQLAVDGEGGLKDRLTSAETVLETKADQSELPALETRLSDAFGADIATAVDTAAADATAKANAAQAAAEAEADRLAKAEAQAAQSAAEANAAQDALAKAEAARDAAITASSDDATAKANAAETAAKTYAEAEAQAKADAAQAEAIRQAKEDATAKANAAKADAEAAAKAYADQQDVKLKGEAAADAQAKADAVAKELHAALQVIERDYSHVWRQDTPPPAGTHYAWEGEPHASESVRLDDDGNETARNWIKDPSFEIGPPRAYGAVDATELSNDHALHGNYSVRSYDKNGGATRLGVNWQIEGPPGYYASSIWVYVPSTNTSLTGRANFQWASDSVSWRRIELVYDQWFKIDDVRFIESGQRGSFWIGLEASGSLAGDHIYFDAAQVAIGDTEAEAISQIESYFDGDTPPDRANDLWYNAEGVPHEWVNGEGWVELDDQRIEQLIEATEAAQAKAEEAHANAGTAWTHADAAMTRAGEAETNAKAHADNLPKVLHGTGAPSGTAPDGSIWWQHQGALSGPVIGQWNRVNGSWQSTPIDSQAIANLDVGKLTAGSAEIAEAVIDLLWARVVRAGLLEADEALIGRTLIADGAVTAEKITATRELITKIMGAEWAYIAQQLIVDGSILTRDLEALSAAIQSLTVTQRADIAQLWAKELWTALAVIEELQAEEAWITSAMISELTAEKVTVTQEFVGRVAELLHLVVDRIDANSLWADQTWQNAGHFGGTEGGYQTQVDGQGLSVWRQVEGEQQLATRLGPGENALSFFDEDTGQLTGSLSQDGSANLNETAVRSLTVNGRDLTHAPHEYQPGVPLLDSMPRGVWVAGPVNMAGVEVQNQRFGFLELSAPVIKGRMYRLTTSNFLTGLDKEYRGKFRYTLCDDGQQVPTVASPELGAWIPNHTSHNVQAGGRVVFEAEQTGVIRVLLCLETRTSSVSGISFNALSTWAGDVRFWMEDLGPRKPGNSRRRYSVSGGDAPTFLDDTPGKNTYVTEWAATWFQNYYAGGATRRPAGNTPNYGISGLTQGLNPRLRDYGAWTSLAGFDGATSSSHTSEQGLSFQAALAGAEIQSVEVITTGAGSLGDDPRFFADIQWAPDTTAPAQYLQSGTRLMASSRVDPGWERETEIPEQYWPLLQTGDWQAVGFAKGTQNSTRDGWIAWGNQRPRIRVTYQK